MDVVRILLCLYKGVLLLIAGRVNGCHRSSECLLGSVHRACQTCQAVGNELGQTTSLNCGLKVKKALKCFPGCRNMIVCFAAEVGLKGSQKKSLWLYTVYELGSKERPLVLVD